LFREDAPSHTSVRGLEKAYSPHMKDKSRGVLKTMTFQNQHSLQKGKGNIRAVLEIVF
jgi:hypothetical protein